jgi:hypothetical protein
MDAATHPNRGPMWIGVVVLVLIAVALAVLAMTGVDRLRPRNYGSPIRTALSVDEHAWHDQRPVLMCVAVRPVPFAEQPSAFNQEFEPWNQSATFAPR